MANESAAQRRFAKAGEALMNAHRRNNRDGRDHSDTIQYDQSKPIRGRFVFNDGTDLPFTKARYINGIERKVKYVEVDGIRYTSDGIDLIEYYDNGKCIALLLDGVRYVPDRRQYHEESYEWMNES